MKKQLQAHASSVVSQPEPSEKDDLISRKALMQQLHDAGGCGAPPESWADGYDKAIDLAYGMAENAPTLDPVTAAAEALGMTPDRLRELAQAEKEGRLVVPPCKVGDTVYRIGASICKWREIDHCDEYCDGWQYRDCWEGTRTVLEEKFSLCDLESIDKTVFLTREAAEAALEEREMDK